MGQDAGGGFIILCFLFLLIYHPNHLLLLASPSPSCDPHQRDALLRFIRPFSINDPSYSFELPPFCYHQNASYPKVDSWREDEDCCSWDGITCDNSTGDVVGLDLTCARLCGFINSSSPLFSLRHLRHLSLAGNDLRGSAIPPEIGMFTRLEYLDLSLSNISGILPTEISHLSKLLSLNLSDTFFPLRIVSVDGNGSNLSYNTGLEMQDHTMRLLVSNLTQLEELDLGSVDMSTVNPTSFMNLSSSLISLKLSDCWLGWKFPEFIFGLPNLQVIDISSNYDLIGTLPKSKWGPNLDYLSLEYCSFTGAVPNSIGNLSRLTHMDLSGNNLMGAVPNSIGNLSRLTYLDLSYNNFTFDLGILSTLEDLQLLYLFGLSVLGEDANHGFSLPKLQGLSMDSCNLSKFPSFLSRSKELRYLSLSENRIQEIPSWLWSIRIDTLEELFLYDNLIKGSIPPSICQLTSLSIIELSGNYLTGIIPQCLGNLTKLQELDLSDNSLSGPLPSSLANCTSLWSLNASYNSIDGASPTSLSTSSIRTLDLRDNNLGGWWPADIFLRSAYWYHIDLSDNKFDGPLPVPSARTSYYSISNNHFLGNLPSLLCNATNLQVLDLSNNSLIGILPDCLKNLTLGLYFLNLRENEFGGQIPEIFYEGSLLTSLDLSRNQLEGPLPRSLSNCKQLEVLDVGNNKITGSFPHWLGNLPLKVLSLRSNNFNGQIIISKETQNFSNVRILDLSGNNFEGNITDEFIGELHRMAQYKYDYGDQYMSSNSGISGYFSVMIDLKGIEMEMVKINVQFAMLDLSSNKFHGEIPKSTELLKSLRGLNFSHNRFTGMIPPSVGNLTYLESLDLSSNHLMGEIPKELVKLTALGFLDLSWNNLTGPIPSGGHFNTFPNSSFQGNPELYGIPLMRSCAQGNKKAQPPSEGKDDGKKEGGGWMVWEYAALGFGTGMGMGISLGYMVLELGRPLWLVRVVIRLEASYWKMSKRKNTGQRRNGRR